jgi:hypothetical protein
LAQPFTSLLYLQGSLLNTAEAQAFMFENFKFKQGVSARSFLFLIHLHSSSYHLHIYPAVVIDAHAILFNPNDY